jgi:hypothetical protein
MHAPFVFSSIQPYPSVAIIVLFFYLEFMWGGAPPPLSVGMCHTLVAVGCLPFSKHTGGSRATPAFSSQLIYLHFTWGSALPPFLELRVPLPLCYMSFFFSCLFIIQGFFLFSLGGGSVCPGGYAELSQGVPHATYLLTW